MKEVEIYTDGACSGNPGPGGYGAILKFADFEKEISGGEPETTNNRMELLGPIQALKLLKEPCKVTLYSDSTYVVDSFSKGWIYGWEKNGWKRKDGVLKNVDLMQELLSLCRIHQVTWVKVKGHADNEYNNRCDRLAVAVSQSFKKESPVIEPEARDTEYDGELCEKVLRTTEKFSGRVFRVEVLDVELPDGKKSTREVVRHNGGAAIVALDNEGYIYMVRQYRIAAGAEMLEIPAGKLEPKEDPKAAALRELTEETGMVAEDCDLLFSMYATPGYCAEKLYVYFVQGLTAYHPHRDEGEFLHIVRMPFDEALEMVLRGEFQDAKTISGILAAARRLGL